MERWMPKNGEGYWCVLDTTPMQAAWCGSQYDIARWEAGNVFKTHDQALIASINIKSLLLSLHYNGTSTANDETLKDNPLPKLTAEVFDRPDCPKWAKYAAVHDGKLFFTDQEPGINEHGHLVSANDAQRIERVSIVPFKSSEDYLSQVIKRPKKDAFDKLLKKYAEEQADKILQKIKEHRLSEQYHNGPVETKLPEWCKVGKWVWATAYNQYFKIDRIDDFFVDGESSAGDLYSVKFENVRQARLRPYNAEETPKLPFEVSEINSDFRTIVVSCKGDKIWLGGASTAISTEELMRDFTIDGSPCGVLEHLENGQWVQ